MLDEKGLWGVTNKLYLNKIYEQMREGQEAVFFSLNSHARAYKTSLDGRCGVHLGKFSIEIRWGRGPSSSEQFVTGVGKPMIHRPRDNPRLVLSLWGLRNK